MSNHKPLSQIKVNNEYGEVKEMIFGRVDDFRLPDYDPVAFQFLDKGMLNLVKEHGGKLFSEATPDWYGMVHDQVEAVVDFIRSRGVIVHRPAENTETELANFALQSRSNINLYNRDSIVAIGDTIFETAFATPERMRDKYPVRYLTMELMRQGNRIISAPQPLDTYNHDNEREVLIEGGDVEIDLDNDGYVYIGHSGNAANQLGYQWLKTTFPEYNVHQIQIDTTRFQHQHLDCVMVIFDGWGIILEEDVIGGIEGLPAPLRERKWVSMTTRESELKLANIIALNPEEIIMAVEAERLIAEIEGLDLGIKIHKFPYGKVGEIGGSLRCNTHPIYRD